MTYLSWDSSKNEDEEGLKKTTHEAAKKYYFRCAVLGMAKNHFL